jgi:hypothetical protein
VAERGSAKLEASCRTWQSRQFTTPHSGSRRDGPLYSILDSQESHLKWLYLLCSCPGAVARHHSEVILLSLHYQTTTTKFRSMFGSTRDQPGVNHKAMGFVSSEDGKSGKGPLCFFVFPSSVRSAFSHGLCDVLYRMGKGCEKVLLVALLVSTMEIP